MLGPLASPPRPRSGDGAASPAVVLLRERIADRSPALVQGDRTRCCGWPTSRAAWTAASGPAAAGRSGPRPLARRARRAAGRAAGASPRTIRTARPAPRPWPTPSAGAWTGSGATSSARCAACRSSPDASSRRRRAPSSAPTSTRRAAPGRWSATHWSTSSGPGPGCPSGCCGRAGPRSRAARRDGELDAVVRRHRRWHADRWRGAPRSDALLLDVRDHYTTTSPPCAGAHEAGDRDRSSTCRRVGPRVDLRRHARSGACGGAREPSTPAFSARLTGRGCYAPAACCSPTTIRSRAAAT